jgi:type IV secretion system protein VirD4
MRKIWAWGIRSLLLVAVSILTVDFVIVGLQYPAVGGIALIAATWRKLRRRWPVSDAFGSARVAGLADLLRGKLLERSGLILGKLGAGPPQRGRALRSLFNPLVTSEWAVRECLRAFLGSRWIGDVFIRVHSFTHLLTVAPAGGGKTVNTLAPNLLSYSGNCVVVDPKGELFKLSAEHRRKRFKHKIIRIDPAALCGPGAAQFNPFDFIDPNSKEFLGAVRDLANQLVVRTGKEIDPHWNDSAENVIAALIAYVCACEGDRESRNLEGMRLFLASRENFAAAVAMMQENDAVDGILRQLGNSLSWHVGRELASVMTNANRHTSIFDDPLIAESTQVTSFNPSELRTGRMTIYLIVPPDRLVIWAGLLRMQIGMLLRIATRGVPTETNPVLFMIDEAAHIGKMQVLSDAITLMRGMGIRIWLFVQSLDQINKCFGDHAGTILDNLGTQQYFSIASYETADALSKRIGDETIGIVSEGDNSGTSSPNGPTLQNPSSRNRGQSSTRSLIGRRILRPEEILVLPDSVALVFHKNLPVIICRRIWHYSDKAFRRGGVGRSRGLGLRAAVAATAALLLAGVATVVVDSLHDEPFRPSSPVYPVPVADFDDRRPMVPPPLPRFQWQPPLARPDWPVAQPPVMPARRWRQSQF